MTDVEHGLDFLTSKIVKFRVAGYTFEQIAGEMAIPTVDVVKTWKKFVETRAESSFEDQQLLLLLRLEDLLTKANYRLTEASQAEDYELLLKLLDRIEALFDLNAKRKGIAEEALEALTRQQTQLVLSAMLVLKDSFRQEIESVLNGAKTIKSIRGELIDNYDAKFMPLAINSLSKVGTE